MTTFRDVVRLPRFPENYMDDAMHITVDGIRSIRACVPRQIIELVNDCCEQCNEPCNCWEKSSDAARWPVPLLNIHELDE